MARIWTVVGLTTGAAALLFLFLLTPSELSWFPKCPFFVLTGYKCPGCGTLRAIHFLLHLNFVEAWRMNPLAVVSIPLIAALAAFPSFRRNAWAAYAILAVIFCHWLLRNVCS